jgi:hypothetical protein
MNIQRTPRWDREMTLVSQLAAAASLFSFLFYFRHSDLLLYGDAVAHMNIARRVIDSRTPGLLQLGTVWLPLPHLLMIPFLFSDAAWQTGIAGAIPSMCAYVLGTAGIFRLVRGALSSPPLSYDQRPLPTGASALHARAAAWLAAGLYAANPNLLYMQTTAMTEVLYLAFFLWSAVHFTEFVQSAKTANNDDSCASLIKCGWCVVGACLTRYDGWFLGAAMLVAAAWIAISLKQNALRRGLVKFVLLALAAPVLWFGYNATIYRNPLEFANGPYSARAIEQQKTALSASSPHPGWHNGHVSFSYFLKAAEDNVAEVVGSTADCRTRHHALLREATLVVSAAGFATAVLHMVNRIRQRANLSSRLVAIFVLQRSLRPRTSSRVRGVGSIDGAFSVESRETEISPGRDCIWHTASGRRELWPAVEVSADLLSRSLDQLKNAHRF